MFGIFINAMMIQIILIDLGISINTFYLFLIQTIPIVLSTLSMVPMGLIVADITLIYLLNLILVPLDIATAVSITFRGLHLGLSSIVGIFSINQLIHKKEYLSTKKKST